MFVFYGLPVALALSCLSSLLVTILFAILTRKKKFQTLVPVLGVLQLTFIIVLVLFFTVGYRLQVAIALPHIQQALDEQCIGNNIEAVADGFYSEDIFRWKTTDHSVECAYTGAWICKCPS